MLGILRGEVCLIQSLTFIEHMDLSGVWLGVDLRADNNQDACLIDEIRKKRLAFNSNGVLVGVGCFA